MCVELRHAWLVLVLRQGNKSFAKLPRGKISCLMPMEDVEIQFKCEASLNALAGVND